MFNLEDIALTTEDEVPKYVYSLGLYHGRQAVKFYRIPPYGFTIGDFYEGMYFSSKRIYNSSEEAKEAGTRLLEYLKMISDDSMEFIEEVFIDATGDGPHYFPGMEITFDYLKGRIDKYSKYLGWNNEDVFNWLTDRFPEFVNEYYPR